MASDLHFEENKDLGLPTWGGYGPSSSQGIVGWLLKNGIVKTQKQAEYLLLAVAGIGICISIFITFTATHPTVPKSKYTEGQNVLYHPE
jgi:hypothetical protein